MMSRSPSSFKRNGPKYKTQPRVLVICEDTKSSKHYLEDASRHFRSFALVKFAHCGRTDPLGVVEGGIKQAKDYERIYCVVDRDSHDRENFERAILLAANHPKTELFVSYPCFEFWLLLHFKYSRAPFAPAGKLSAADCVSEALREYPEIGEYEKGNVKGLFEKLLPLLDLASQRAAQILVAAEAEGEKNPSTPLHMLVSNLRELGSLSPV
jgi:hypothetical protein